MTSKLCACYPLNGSISSFSSLSAAIASTGTNESERERVRNTETNYLWFTKRLLTWPKKFRVTGFERGGTTFKAEG